MAVSDDLLRSAFQILFVALAQRASVSMVSTLFTINQFAYGFWFTSLDALRLRSPYSRKSKQKRPLHALHQLHSTGQMLLGMGAGCA